MTESKDLNRQAKSLFPGLLKFQVITATFAAAVTIGFSAYIPTLVRKKAALERDIAQLTKQSEELTKKNSELVSSYQRLAVGIGNVNPEVAKT